MTQNFVQPAGYGYSTSIEDEIADVYVSPAPPKRICQWEPRPGYPACTTPLAQANRESLCYRHTKLEQTLKTIKAFSRSDEPAQPRPQETAPPKELLLCAVMDCHRKLQANNKSGRCAGHYFVQTGMQMKDGSIPKPMPIAPITPIKPLQPIAALPQIQPLEPIEPDKEEEMTPMSDVTEVTEETEEQEETRAECAVMDCTALLMSNNSTGRCKSHGYLKKGMQMKDGTIPKPKKDPVVKAEREQQECAVLNCQVALGAHNRTGRCNAHHVLQRGMQLKDGSVPRPHTAFSRRLAETQLRNAAAGAPQQPVEPACGVDVSNVDAGLEFATEILYPAGETPMSVTLKVPIEAIDRFWTRLTLEHKTRIVEREIFGGL